MAKIGARVYYIRPRNFHHNSTPHLLTANSNHKGEIMDFIDQLRVLASRVITTKDLIQTEEATKNAMIMPLIQKMQ